MLTAEQISKFKTLFEARFGQTLSDAQAFDMGIKLLMLVKLTACPEVKSHKECNERNLYENSPQNREL